MNSLFQRMGFYSQRLCCQQRPCNKHFVDKHCGDKHCARQSVASVPSHRPIGDLPIVWVSTGQRTGFSLTSQQIKKTILVFCVLFAASFAVFPSNLAAQSTLMELRNQSRELLREHAMADDSATQQQLTTALCDLYVVLRSDDRYWQSDMLQQDAGKIRRRLLTTASQITAKLRHQKIVRPTELGDWVDDAIEKASEKRDSESSSDESIQPPAAMAAGGIADNGWQLVELIQRVVAPDFWETNGGSGTIQYFAMRRVLVVRATSDVHEQIRDLLLALPR
ncbi:MAG: hypothetical protein WBD20_14660 [Pirellulaceae bacterium]